MRYNKSVVAAGFLVGIIVVTIILRVRFYFYPPQDRLTDQFTNLVAVTVPTEDIIPDLKPVDTKQALYNSDPIITDLTTGLPLASATQSGQVFILLLRGSDLVIWSEQSEQVLHDNITLVNGQPPVASLTVTANGFVLVVDRLVERYDTVWQLRDSLTLPVSPRLVVANDDTVWFYTADSLMTVALPTGTVLAQQIIIDKLPCALVLDNTDVVTIQTSDTNTTFTKLNNLGVAQPAIVAQLTLPDSCQSAVRAGKLVALVFAQQISLLDDNLVAQYVPITLTPNMIAPQVLIQDDGLSVIYSTSETLGNYTTHLAKYLTPTSPVPR
ncbi:MAG: hypothetical protein WCV88_05440 [Patescibacteria group bacterium]